MPSQAELERKRAVAEKMAICAGAAASPTLPELINLCDQGAATILALLAENERLRGALTEIAEAGTTQVSQRVGDAYDPNGWNDYEIISDEAATARQALDAPHE